jgi:hypothetical protein
MLILCIRSTVATFLLAVMFLCLAPSLTYAKQAQFLLYPTRLVLENGERTASVSLKNNGDATGTYRAEMVEMIMSETTITEGAPDEETPFSAKKLIRISPRSITLAPGEEQNIRLVLRVPSNTEDGEYRSHLKVTMTDDNVEPVVNDEATAGQKGVAISIKPRLALVIPVIIRHGQTNYKITVANAKLHYEKDETGKNLPYVDVTLLREGNRSSMGDIDVNYINEAGKSFLVKHLAGIPVYRPTERRTVTMQLDTPSNLTIGKGTLHITYKAQEKEGGGVIAEAKFPL